MLAHRNYNLRLDMSQHIILISSQSVFKKLHAIREATNANFIVFGLTRPVLEPMNFRNRGKHTHHYSTNAVQDCCICCGSTKHFIVFERFKLFRYFRIVVCMLQEVNTNNCLSDFELYFTGLLYML